jgi:hypothetical protein
MDKRPEHKIVTKKYKDGHYVDDAEVSTNAIAKGMTPESLAGLLEDYVNTFSSGYKRGQKTGRSLQRTHRTLQRSVIVELVGVIAGLAEQEHTDPRNKQSIALAKKIKELYEEHGAGMMV